MKQISSIVAACTISGLALLLPGTVHAQDSSALAKQLSNPVAALISVPFQYNWNHGYGPNGDGVINTLNIQPVIPIPLDDQWNLISRTIVPVVWQKDIIPGTEQHGIGDVVQSLFFSPQEVTDGITWGAGPVFLLPSYSDPLLSTEKWGVGPTGVILKQEGGWTYGALANHIWSFAGNDDRADVNSTFLQPFIVYTTPDAWSFALNTESTYDWNAETWSVPINASVSKLVNFGSQPVSFQVGARYWATSPEGGPEGWGVRASMTFLFPTGG